MLIISTLLFILALCFLLYSIFSFRKVSGLKRFISISLIILFTIGGSVTLANWQSSKKTVSTETTRVANEKKNSSHKSSSSRSKSSTDSVKENNTDETSISSSSSTSDEPNTDSSSSTSTNENSDTSSPETNNIVSLAKNTFSDQISAVDNNQVLTVTPTNSDLITKISRIATHNQEPYNFDDTKSKLLSVSKQYPQYTIKLIDASTKTEIFAVKNSQIVLDKIYQAN